MSYLHNKQIQRRKIAIGGLIAFFLALLIFFRAPIFRGFSVAAHAIFSPFIYLKNSISHGFGSLGTAIRSKQSLEKENENLKKELEEIKISSIDRSILLDENVKLKEILGRTPVPKNTVLASILLKPNQSPYDSLVVDVGEDMGIKEGDRVFAYGNTLIGQVASVYASTSTIKLFSTPGETITLVVSGKDIYSAARGIGGGTFEVTLPREISVPEGTALSLPGTASRVVAIVQKIISDSRDPFQKLLAQSPVNIQELRFIEIEK